MDDIQLENLCKACFSHTDGSGTCSACGYTEGARVQSPLYLTPGSILNGQYLAGKMLFSDSVTATYLGFDLNSEAKVVIKEYLPQSLVVRTPGRPELTYYTDDKKAPFEAGLAAFIGNTRPLLAFNHKNAARAIQCFLENGTAYLVMEYVEGTPLNEWIEQKGKMPPNQAAAMLVPLLDALTALHAAGGLHGNICPENILVAAGGVKLVGFGSFINKPGSDDSANKSVSELLQPGFAPEEQYRSKGKRGPWTDVYAAAAVLYYMVTGLLPQESLERAGLDELKMPGQTGIKVPAAFDRMMSKALAVRAQDRYQTMAEFKDALEAAAQLRTFWGTKLKKLANPQERKKAIVWLSAGAVFVAALVIIFILLVVPLIKYNQALTCMNSGNYDKAAAMFSELGNYSDSKDKIIETRYQKAKSFFDGGQYDEAKALYAGIGGYSDASKMVYECDYRKAGSLLNGGQFDAAKTIFSQIAQYSDSAVKMQECDYRKATNLLNNAKYDEAKAIFTQIAQYADCAAQIQECDYRKASAILNDSAAADYTKAAELFESLKSYKDSADLFGQSVCKQMGVLLAVMPFTVDQSEKAKSWYEAYAYKGLREKLDALVSGRIDALLAQNQLDDTYNLVTAIAMGRTDNEVFKEKIYGLGNALVTAKKYDRAQKIFEQISDYKDSSTLIKECKYNTAVELTKTNKNEAALMFYDLKTYKDSKKRLQKIYTPAKCFEDIANRNFHVTFEYTNYYGYSYYYNCSFEFHNDTPFTLKGGINFNLEDYYGNKTTEYCYFNKGYVLPGEIVTFRFTLGTYYGPYSSYRCRNATGSRALSLKLDY